MDNMNQEGNFFAKNRWVLLAIAVVLIVGGIWQYNKSSKNDDGNKNDQTNNTENNGETTPPPPAGGSITPAVNPPAGSPTGSDVDNESTTAGQLKYTGTLKLSDNSARGKYILTTKYHVLYIKTSRDYSALVGKQVIFTASGTLNSFMLGDIIAK